MVGMVLHWGQVRDMSGLFTLVFSIKHTLSYLSCFFLPAPLIRLISSSQGHKITLYHAGSRGSNRLDAT